MALRFLIIGGSGLVGKRLRLVLGSERTTATYATRPFPGGIQFDATKSRLADAALARGACYTHAFVLLGVTNIDVCDSDPAGTARTNVEAVCSVIDELVAEGIMPVFASSDAVFDGTRGLSTEEDPVNPILAYGAQKLRVEQYLAARRVPHLTVRLAKVVTSDPEEGGIIKEWIDRLEAGAEIRCARDQRFSPVDANDAAEALTNLVLRGCTGLFHVCGPRPVTRLEFLNTLAEEVRRYRRVAPSIAECSLLDLFPRGRPLDTSMSCAKAERVLATGFKDVREVCRDAAQRRYGLGHAGVRDAGMTHEETR